MLARTVCVERVCVVGGDEVDETLTLGLVCGEL
jgi:hypothetical protein